MGPLRRGIALALCPTAVIAEVCDKERPNWDGTQASAFTEALALFSTPLGLILILSTAVAFTLRNAWLGLGTVVGWTGLVTIAVSKDPTGIQESAIAEGCTGPPTLFIAAAIAICIATILYTAPRRAGDN